MRKLLVALLLCAFPAFAQSPTNPTILAVPLQASADTVSSYTFKTVTGTGTISTTDPAKRIVSLTVKNAATVGFAMLFDATALPANGAVTPLWCEPMAANTSINRIFNFPAGPAVNGITAGYSSTGCDSLTASATAKFMGQAF